MILCTDAIRGCAQPCSQAPSPAAARSPPAVVAAKATTTTAAGAPSASASAQLPRSVRGRRSRRALPCAACCALHPRAPHLRRTFPPARTAAAPRPTCPRVQRVHYTTVGLRLTTQPRPHQASDTAPTPSCVFVPATTARGGAAAKRAATRTYIDENGEERTELVEEGSQGAEDAAALAGSASQPQQPPSAAAAAPAARKPPAQPAAAAAAKAAPPAAKSKVRACGGWAAWFDKSGTVRQQTGWLGTGSWVGAVAYLTTPCPSHVFEREREENPRVSGERAC
jgi:hypothetical protein